MQEVVSSEIDH